MSRKPVHETTLKRKSSGRQAQWEAIRQHKGAFTHKAIVAQTKQHPDTVRTFLECLVAGEFLKLEGASVRTGTMTLTKAAGYHAPRVRPDGSLVEQGSVNAAIWDGLRTMKRFTIEEMLEALRIAGQPSTKQTVKSYCNVLVQAGYLQLAQRGNNKRPSIYQLIRHTGRQAPMIQTTKNLYDPNLKKVVWEQKPEVCS